MSEYIVPVFNSREAVNAFLTHNGVKTQMASSEWQRAFRKPITRLNSVLDESLNRLGIDLNSCWEDIPQISGKVRRIGINWKRGSAQEMVVTESRIEDEPARFEIKIRYPDTSGWEVYTLSLRFDAYQIVVVADDTGVPELATIRVSQMPILDLQLSEAPCRRLGLDPQSKFGGDYLFGNLGGAKRIFIQGVEQVRQVLKEPNVEVTP